MVYLDNNIGLEVNIIINDDYILGRLYVPIIIIILLVAMIYFHRHHVFRYLYLANIFCYLIAEFCYLIAMNRPAGEDSRLWINVVPFIWLIGICSAYFLSAISIGAFVIEHAQRHTWAKVTVGIVSVVFIVLCIIGIIYFIMGILSLKSG